MKKMGVGDFVDFIKKQGIVGLAVGFILGGAISKVVTSLVEDIVNPFLGLILGAAGSLGEASFKIASVEIRWGNFVSVLIDFLVITLIVYFICKSLGIKDIKAKGKVIKK